MRMRKHYVIVVCELIVASCPGPNIRLGLASCPGPNIRLGLKSRALRGPGDKYERKNRPFFAWMLQAVMDGS